MNAVHPTDVWQGAGRRVFFNEVGTRDGLQMEQACLLYTSPSPRDS